MTADYLSALNFLIDDNLRCNFIDPKHARPPDVEAARRRVIETCEIACISIEKLAAAMRKYC